MKALAAITLANKDHSRGDRHAASTPAFTHSATQGIGHPVLQRQSACACGGGCPRCAEEESHESLQTELRVSTPGDQFEQEADRVAGVVVGAGHDSAHRVSTPAITQVMRQDQNSNQSHQRRPTGLASRSRAHARRRDAALAGDHARAANQGLHSPGEPLDADTLGFMEARLGRDLSRVRVHTSSQADASAQALNARAYTVGGDIVFAAGAYRPDSWAGRRLLAHELTHTIQQGAVQRSARERGPDTTVDSPQSASHTSTIVMREEKPEEPEPVAAVTLSPDALTGANEHNEKVAKNLVEVDKKWVPRYPKLPPPDTIHQAQFFLRIDLARPRRGRYKMKSGIYVPQDALKAYQTKNPTDEVDPKVPMVEGQWLSVLPPLSEAVAKWQAESNKELGDQKKALPVDGKLTTETVAAMKAKGMASSDKVDWEIQDQIDWMMVRYEETGFRALAGLGRHEAGITRQAIVALAEAQIGQVYAANRGDQKKYGWERILRYYQVAFGGEDDLDALSTKLQAKLGKDAAALEKDTSPEAKELRERQGQQKYFKERFGEAPSPFAIKDGTETAPATDPWKRIQAADKFAFPDQGPWSWCGIFTMWAVKAITGRGYWDARPEGLTEVKKANDPTLAGAKPGDILAMRTSNSHFCLLAAAVPPNATPATKLHTIDGNVEVQSVAASNHWTVDHVGSYFKAVEDPAPAPSEQPAGTVQRKAANANSVTRESVERAVRARDFSGQPLDASARARMEQHFGRDLSSVRVHTDAPAAEAANEINARAYTIGQDIHFAAGAYDPSSLPGRRLLAHELAHTIQQSRGETNRSSSLEISKPGDADEIEAERVGQAVGSGDSAQAVGAAQPKVARESPGETDEPAQPADNPPAVNASTVLPFKARFPGEGGGWEGDAILKASEIDPGSKAGKAITAGPDEVWKISSQMATQTADELKSLKTLDDYWVAIMQASLHSSLFSIDMTFLQATYGELDEFATLTEVLSKQGEERKTQLVDWSKQPKPETVSTAATAPAAAAATPQVIDVRKWPSELPRAVRDEAHAITIKKGTPAKKQGGKVVTPTVQNTAEVPDIAKPTLDKNKQAILDEITKNREALPDRLTGTAAAGAKGRGGIGYMYAGKNPGAPTSVKTGGADDKAKREKWIWEEVGSEGGASSINTYDDMDLTYGKGFAKTTLPDVLNSLFAKDPEAKNMLLDAGLGLEGSKWLVVNTDLGAVEEGSNALHLLEVNTKLLSLLMTMGEDPKHAQTNLDVQWAKVMVGAGNYPAYAATWSENAFKIGFHLAHWLPGYGWGNKKLDYQVTGGDILKIVKVFAKAAAGAAKTNGAYLVPGKWGLQSHLAKFGGGAGLTTLKAATGNPVTIAADKVESDSAWSGKLLIPDGKDTYRTLDAAL